MSEEVPAVLAVDGGNSKTDVALVGGDGTLLALVRGPGMPHRLSDETVQVLGKLVSAAVKLAEQDPMPAAPADEAAGRTAARSAAGHTAAHHAGTQEGSGLAARHLVACVANADLPAEERQLEEKLREQGWAESSLVANDTYAVLRAGLADVPAEGAARHWGVGVTCGTGINCVGIAPDGRTVGFLALGESTGDWGGGSGLGLAAQWHAMRASDGRGPHTALREAVPAHFGLDSPADVAVAIHLGEVFFGELAGLSPVIFQTADSGDEVARGLVLRQAEEIFLLARSAIRQLDLTEARVPVVLGGGIVAARHPLLIDRVTQLIMTEFPAAVVHVVTRAPVVGAALMGLDLAGASVAAKQQVRRSFTDEVTASPGQPTLISLDD